MVGREIEFADDADALRFRLHTLELDARTGIVELRARQRRVEIEVPPGAREFAVGDDLEPGLLLLADDPADFSVLHALEFCVRNLVRLAHDPRFREPFGAQQTADMIGAERLVGVGHRNTPFAKTGEFRLQIRPLGSGHVPHL